MTDIMLANSHTNSLEIHDTEPCGQGRTHHPQKANPVNYIFQNGSLHFPKNINSPHTGSTHTSGPLPSILRRMTASRSISRARRCDRRRSYILRSLPRHRTNPCPSHRKVRHICRTRSSLATQLEERRTVRRLAARASTPCFPFHPTVDRTPATTSDEQ